MKRAKLLSLFLAGSLLFQTAGIDAMATAPSEPAPISDNVEDIDNNSEQSSTEESGTDESAGEEENPGQSIEGEEGKGDEDPSGEEGNPQQPSEDEEDKDSTGEEENPEQPIEGEKEDEVPTEEIGEKEDSISENTVSENTISENTLPEEEISIFSIFPGLGDDYKFSSQQLADKRVLATHLDDVVRVQSVENATVEDYQDATGKYELGEVVYLAETKKEAEQVAAAFGGALDSYSSDVAVIRLPEKATVALAVAAAAESEIKLPAVWPNYYNYLYIDTNATVNPAVPSDPDYTKQWHHDYIGTRYAWAAGYKGQGVKVAVIDTGLARNHEDLKANAVDGRTYVDDAEGTVQTADNQTHGTHVAGIIAADDNGKGVVGIAPDAQVRGYSVFGSDSRCTTDWIIRAINDAVDDGNDIINMSLGSPNWHGGYEKAVTNAYTKGVAIFAASGNDDSNGNNFPAAYAKTISVGAVDENSARASFSNYGNTVTLAFPGVDIYSTTNSGYTDTEQNKTYGSYDYMDGTSMACPAAAGTAAVILSAKGDIRGKTGKARVDALLSAMKSSTTKCSTSGMGAGTTYLPGVLKIATDMTAPEIPVINVVDEGSYDRGTNKKDYIAESISVTLSSATAVGVDIYYSTDGKTPAYKNGVITNVDSTTPYRLGDRITLTGAKNKTIKAIAVNPVSGKVSKVVSKTVTLTPIPTGVTVTPVGNVTKIVAGKSLKFNAAVAPAYAISNKVQWTVAPKDASITETDITKLGIKVASGNVTTNAQKTSVGTYIVTATAVGSDGKTFTGGKIGSCTFEVIASSAVKKVAFVDSNNKNKAPLPKSIKTTDSKTADVDNKVINLADYLTVTKAGATAKQDSVITGNEALAEVVWSSSNTKVATVSNKGVITAVAPGKATIKATSNDGGNKSASYNVTVVQPVTKITISGPTKVAVGKGIALTAAVEPANASNKKIEWTVSGGGKIVKIGKNNGKITTTKEAKGSYTVTAAAADKLGAAVATYTISIENQEITEIKLNANKLTMFPPNTSAKNNTTATLTATIKGKVNGSKQAEVLNTSLFTWTSSAPSIADVDQNGKITAKAPGKATITCAATDGSNKKGTCAVTVTVPMSKLVIGPTDGNVGYIAVGKKVKMAAKYYSNYGTPTSKKIDWKIINCNNVTDKEVTIDKNGTVSVKKDIDFGGSFVVQATAQDGSGVTSNGYEFTILPCFVAARLKLISTVNSQKKITGYYFMVEATAVKDKKGKPDWNKVVELPSTYCTATVSGPKNIGLSKSYVKNSAGTPFDIWGPEPLKTTSLQLDYLIREEYKDYPYKPRLYTKDCDKITLTVTLKDGSNLKATVTKYAVGYMNTDGKYVIGYF